MRLAHELVDSSVLAESFADSQAFSANLLCLQNDNGPQRHVGFYASNLEILDGGLE